MSDVFGTMIVVSVTPCENIWITLLFIILQGFFIYYFLLLILPSSCYNIKTTVYGLWYNINRWARKKGILNLLTIQRGRNTLNEMIFNILQGEEIPSFWFPAAGWENVLEEKFNYV